ncbi:MAG: DEAD/DEAH box helicase [Pseudomonadota bacterium]
MNSLKIGFPIVIDDTCYAVWIETAVPSRGEQTSITWNNKQLNPNEPFHGAAQLNKTINKILDHQSIKFTCDAVQPKKEKGTYSVSIKGESFGLALSIATHYTITCSNTAEFEILLTGKADDSSEPSPLKDKESLQLKGKYATQNGYILIVLGEDYKLLDLKSGGLKPKKVLPNSFKKLKEEIESIKKDIDEDGFAYILPVTLGGRWENSEEEEEEDWWKILAGQVFGFQRLVSEQQTFEEETSYSPVNRRNNAEIISPKPGTIGEVYGAALSNESEYLTVFLRQNSELCQKTLFENGLLEEALKQKDKLFFDRKNYDEYEEFDFLNILVGGPTGCGKTFLAEAIMLNSVLERPQGVAIYIAPSRSLVYERHNELVKRFYIEELENYHIKKNDIVFSTGEIFDDDVRIRKGKFKIALIVYEKANLFLEPSFDLLSKIQLVVIDELHMLTHEGRGGVVDMLVAKLIMENRKRDDDNRLRITAITTEEFTENEKIQKVFTRPDEPAPVVISTAQRPICVEHLIHIYGVQKQDDRHLKMPDKATKIVVPIVEFSNQEDRYLKPEKLE